MNLIFFFLWLLVLLHRISDIEYMATLSICNISVLWFLYILDILWVQHFGL